MRDDRARGVMGAIQVSPSENYGDMIRLFALCRRALLMLLFRRRKY